MGECQKAFLFLCGESCFPQLSRSDQNGFSRSGTKIGELCCGNFDGSFFTRFNLSCPIIFMQFHIIQCTGCVVV
jgi:hypothetical protein